MTVPRNRLKMAFDEACVSSSQQQVQNRSTHPQRSKRSSHATTRENNNRATCMHFPVLHVRKPHIRAWSSLMVRQSAIMFRTCLCHFDMWFRDAVVVQRQLPLPHVGYDHCCLLFITIPIAAVLFPRSSAWVACHSRYCQTVAARRSMLCNDPAVSHTPFTPATSSPSFEFGANAFYSDVNQT